MASQNGYRKLNSSEIGELTKQGCESDNWSLVEVKSDFNTKFIHNSKFTGTIRIGGFNKKVDLFGGISHNSGIYNAWLNNCRIGDNVLIFNIGSYISNYDIKDDAVIQNVNRIAVEGESTFGNGIRVKAINEDGGRDIPIYDHLTTHIAYIFSLYRHKKNLIEKLEQLVSGYIDFVRSDMGEVGEGARVINCDNLQNLKIGQAARLEGVKKLSNGTINSSHSDPVCIGDGVIMENFIVCSGSTITDSTLISNCFIGQGCILDKQYSAVESLFFANCQGFHGEATSIFAGPYTVTHHKSTLLIAGMFSFLNAGSGSNQSNHMYKLGPIHQGVLERGVKTTSDSYMLWPSHIGAFSLVMGRHYKHSDTSDFPFSYLIESNDESILVPGINIKSVGTIRDSKKWPLRDRRKDPKKLDQINFNLLSPYTIQKMIRGREILLNLRKEQEPVDGNYIYNDMLIRESALDRGIHLYSLAIYKFLGNSLITRLSSYNIKSNSDVFKSLEKDTPVGTGRWVDLSGLICPAETLNKLFEDIESSRINSIEEINSILTSIHHNYYSYEWSWASDIFGKVFGKSLNDMDINNLIDVINKWKESVLTIDRYLYDDAKKEFTMLNMTGFGIDGEEQDKHLDFGTVRGEFSTNPMVMSITEHIEKKEKLGNNMQELLTKYLTVTNKV